MPETPDNQAFFQDAAKSVGGVAPFGYRWQSGVLVIDEREAPVRKLIYELFLRHRRKKTVARFLNELGYRTRSGALFSDTTIDRLLRDTTAKGIRMVEDREIRVEPIVSVEIWESANTILGISQIAKQPAQLFAGIIYCSCGGKMTTPSNSAKYICSNCHYKIRVDDLEEIFVSQLEKFPINLGNGAEAKLSDYWHNLTPKERRIIIEQICDKIVAGNREINIEFSYQPVSIKMAAFGQQIERGNKTGESVSVQVSDASSLNEPLLSEQEAARFLGISKMTLLRRRNAGEIGFFRVGFRILYSKEKHLLPFLKECEKGK